jgi:hypothetical protein
LVFAISFENLYRRLRVIETEMEVELTPSRIEALQTDLASIDRAARILPFRHSDLFFPLIMHIDLTRTRLASRLRHVARLKRRSDFRCWHITMVRRTAPERRTSG